MDEDTGRTRVFKRWMIDKIQKTGNIFAPLVLITGAGELTRLALITPGWSYKAAANFKLIFSDSLYHESLDHLAARLARLFVDVKTYNESIRANVDIPPEVKLWLVIP